MTRSWWDEGRGWSSCAETGTVRVIDSWLVDDGRVRGFERHALRFGKACSQFYGPATDSFLRAVAEALPTQGRWFPRVELVEAGARMRLRLWLRPAPPRTTTVRLWNSGPDRRTLPAVKGIDLDELNALRAKAITAGADEALLLSADGNVLEGSTTSIVWWRGDTLCAPPPGPQLLPGVTRALLGELAGRPVVSESATPAGLADALVWAVNALHGIRPVIAGLGRFRDGDAAQAERWQARLESLAVPVPAA